MPEEKSKPRKRMVVEEVGETTGVANAEPVEEIKEKVEELQTITEHMGDDVEKSAEVQDEITEAAEKIETPAPATEKPQPEYIPASRSSGPNPLIILIPGVLLLGALLGGVYFYQKSVNMGVASPTPSPLDTTNPSSSTAPSASPSAKLDLTKYPIKVQNGSGIPGTAGSAKDLLTKAGFKVSTAGNADNYNYTDTIIKVKSDVPADFVTKLTTTLSGMYKVAKTQTLDDTSKDEVVVIIGASKSQ